MKNKGEKIKEAWIAEIGEEKYSEVKHLIDENGIVDAQYEVMDDEIYEDLMKIFDEMDEIDNYKYRPKLLQGIETNNGWNRIDEVGLPEVYEDYYFIIDSDGLMYSGVYYSGDDIWIKGEQFFSPTHYMFYKPQLPIY